MIVEITGVHPRNKGARLMLEAICAKMRAEFPGAALAVQGPWPEDLRVTYGLWQTEPRRGRSKLRVLAHAPRTLRKLMHVMPRREVDVVLDASGFAYGDYWDLKKLEMRLGAFARDWKTADNTLVVLPQALGPFHKPSLRAAFGKALDGVDLLYARDRISLEHVNELANGHGNVRLAPDFTNLLKPELPKRLAHLAGRALIIPNEKMVANGRAESRTEYVRFLALVAAMLDEAGHDLLFVVHGGPEDRSLAEDVNAALRRPIDIVDEPSASATKALIAASTLIVSSRFHGLVSALSSGVPALACGWSHKYRELMADYGSDRHIVDMAAPERWQDAIGDFIAAADQADYRVALNEAAARERVRSEAMWTEVCDLIRARGHA